MASLLSKAKAQARHAQAQAPWTRQENKTQAPQQEDDQSLITILPTREDRGNLILLVADCTDCMRADLSSVFDPDATGENTTDKEVDIPVGDEKAEDQEEEKEYAPELEQRGNSGEEPREQQTPEKVKHEADETQTQDDKLATAQDKARTERERRVKEIESPEMQELKTAALAYFDEWHDSVLERVGLAINQQAEDASEQHAQNKPHTVPEKHIEEPVSDPRVNKALVEAFPPRQTPLKQLDRARKVLILHSMLLLLLGLEHYPSESRVLLLYLSTSLDLPLEILTEDETKVARGLLDAAERAMSADEETKAKAEQNSNSRRWKVGLGAVGGAVLIGVTGGLAAPLLAAGIGTVMGGLGLGATATATYLGAMAGSAPLVGALFGTYGGYRAAATMDNYSKEVTDFAFVPTRRWNITSSTAPSTSVEPVAKEPHKDTQRLRVAIGISGWLTTESEVVTPWHVLSPQGFEPFALRWEMAALLKLGNSLKTLMKSAAWGAAKTGIMKATVFGALSAGLWPLGIVKVARVVDNPFSIARSRSEKAGKILADALINRVQGQRPVTLIGYSLGARVIYYCLDELANRQAFGLVESVLVAGAAVPSDAIGWRKARSVVAGRIVNVYSTNDYLLGFLYRTSSFQYGIAGLQPIKDVEGIQNIDVSSSVDGHTTYRYITGSILQKAGFLDVDNAAAEKQEKERVREAQKEQAERERKQQERKEATKDRAEPGEDVGEDADEMEQEVERAQEQSGAMNWISGKVSALNIMGRNNSEHEAAKDVRSPSLSERRSVFRKRVGAHAQEHESPSYDEDDEDDHISKRPSLPPRSSQVDDPASDDHESKRPSLPPRGSQVDDTASDGHEAKRPSLPPRRSQFDSAPSESSQKQSLASPAGVPAGHDHESEPVSVADGPIKLEDNE